MSRKTRSISPIDTYHVVIKSMEQEHIFSEEVDKKVFISILKNNIFTFQKEDENNYLISFCIMSNHVHMLIKSSKLSKFMHKLNTFYAGYYNKKYIREGHLFKNRFFSQSIMDENHMKCCIRYIHLNPQAANICRINEYSWSSHKLLFNRHYDWIRTNIIENLFISKEEYVNFIRNKIEDFYVFSDESKLSEKEALIVYKNHLQGQDIRDLSIHKQCYLIWDLHNNYLKYKQISTFSKLSIARVKTLKKKYEILRRRSEIKGAVGSVPKNM